MNEEIHRLTTGLNTSADEEPGGRKSQEYPQGMLAILSGVVQQPMSYKDTRKSGTPIIQAQESLVVMRPKSITSDLHSNIEINRAESMTSDRTGSDYRPRSLKEEGYSNMLNSSVQRRKLEEQYFGRGLPLGRCRKVDMETFVQYAYSMYFCAIFALSIILIFWFYDQKTSPPPSDFPW